MTWAIVANCGDCFFCRRDLPQKCLKAVKYGHEAFRPGEELLGGVAEHCLLVRGTSIVAIPEELPLEVACPASCATSTIAAALEGAGDLQDRTVCVLGAGMLGLTACAMARSCGASSIVCVDQQTPTPGTVAGVRSDRGHGPGWAQILSRDRSPENTASTWSSN